MPKQHSVNPATGEIVASYELHTHVEVQQRLQCVARATHAWPTTTINRRANLLRDLAALLRRDKATLALQICDEMGKPISEARAELEKCASALEYYAEHGPALLENVAIASDALESFVAWRPLGALLAIMPWNYPYWQVIRCLAPALLAGNVVLLKHAPNVTGCAFALERLLREAGAPEGVLTCFVVDEAQVAQLIADERVHAVTLTGSSKAGAAVARLAGQALKKTVLELGGSDAFVVCADADVAAAAACAVRSRYQNAGQSCIAAKRFLIDRRVYDEFLTHLTTGVEALRMGDPREDATTVGPLARHDLRAVLADQVERARVAGAQVHLGGHSVEGPGYFYEPTILTEVTEQMSVAREEVFGPVASLFRVEDVEAAVHIANASGYGLSATLWTTDLDRAKRLAARLQVGAVFINGLVKSDPRLPFGGVKQSGYGRELGFLGMHEFLNAQTVWLSSGAELRAH